MTLPDSAYFKAADLERFSLANYAGLAEFSLEEWGQMIEKRLAACNVVDFIEAQRRNPNRRAERAYYLNQVKERGMQLGHLFPVQSYDEEETGFNAALNAIAAQILTRPLGQCDFFDFLQPSNGGVRISVLHTLEDGHGHYDVRAFHLDRQRNGLQKVPPSRFVDPSRIRVDDWIDERLVPHFDLRLLGRLRQKKFRDEDLKKLLFPEANEYKWTKLKRRLGTGTNKVFNYTVAATLVGPTGATKEFFKSQVPKVAG